MDKIPFTYGRVALTKDFTNRKRELTLLKRNFSAGVNTILISPRRWGKTSLVRRASKEVMRDHLALKVCHLDIFNVRSEQEFYIALANKVLQSTSSKWEDIGRNARTFLSRLIPSVSISSDHLSEISFGLDMEEITRKPDDILDLAENIAKKKKIKIVVCIDEFQSIATFTDPDSFQKKLRAHWQNHQQVTYCLYGSKRNMLLNLFSNPSMPFYKFGNLILLEKIETADWISFIQNRFKDTGKQISPRGARFIVTLTENHPYYVQQLAQQAWFRTDKTCDDEIIRLAFDALIDQLSLLFADMTEDLSVPQINLLKAILAGEKQLTAQEVLKRYHLNSSANVVRLKKKLLAKEVLDENEGEINFLDPLYKRWMQVRFLNH